jgi:lysophospholipase L1-like esterase
MSDDLSRREFLLALSAAIATTALRGSVQPESRTGQPRAGQLILFQGDSITDASRNRMVLEPNVARALGTGYPLLISSNVLREKADRGLRFLNRGISGNKVPDLAQRWAEDTIALKPDIVSVLIGVNDYWHHLLNGYPGTVKDYEDGYTALLEQTRRELPQVRLVVLEPFVLRTGAVDARWFPEFDERRVAAARVARRARATWVPLQRQLDAAARKTGPAYWAADGVHPTPAGHGLIAEQWRRTVGI